jgi:ADP-ribose pyrophosphatase YjhB (NUDIX family)
LEKSAARQCYFLQVVSKEEAGFVPLHMGRALAWNEQRPLHLTARQKSSAAQLLLVAREAGVWVERIPRGQSFFLNDVQIKHGAWMKPGDELRLGAARLLLLGEAERPLQNPRMIQLVELEERLEEALLAPGADKHPVLFLVSVPHLHRPARAAFQKRLMREVASWQLSAFWSTLAWELLACVLPAAPVVQARAWRQRLEEAAGKASQVAWASFPEDGLCAAALMDSAWVKLRKVDARVEPVLESASMVRLSGMVQELRKAMGPLLVVGGEGQGRAWLLSQWLEGTPHVEYQAIELLEAEPVASAFVVRSFDRLPAERRQALLDRAKAGKFRMGATAGESFEEARYFAWRFRVPPLAQRPEDIWPLAQAVVASVKRKTNRPRLFLREAAREHLERYAFPGGVRELKNGIVQAAVASLRDEVGKEALPSALTLEDTPGTYEEQMAASEYRILLESLVRARWNVSAAAKRLGLPRRTLVFRMAKLGFRRPHP